MRRRGRSIAKVACIAVAASTISLLINTPAQASFASRCADVAAALVARHTVAVAEQPDVTRLTDDTVSVCGYELSIAWLSDILFLAESNGLTVPDALSRYTWQEEFALLANRVREQYPKDYAGAEFIPDGRSWIAFKGSVPDAVVASVDRDRVEVIGGRGFSEAEVNAILVKEFARVANSPGVGSSSGGYDPVSGDISIEIWPSAVAAAQKLVTTRASENPMISIDVRLASGPIGRPDREIYGGGHIASCTAAFNVIHTGGARGTTTAHHCATDNAGNPVNTMTYRWHDTGSTSMALGGRHGGQYGDIAWYRNTSSSHTVGHWFYSNTNTIRSVRSTRLPVLGETLLKYGRTTGQGSEEVYRLNWCVDYDDVLPQYCGLTAMHRTITDGGDSGGPWFTGNTAIGLHSGTWWNFPHFRSVFTPVQGNLFNGLSVVTMIG